jgi:hypothetical protein
MKRSFAFLRWTGLTAVAPALAISFLTTGAKAQREIEISTTKTPPASGLELRRRLTLSDDASPLHELGSGLSIDSRGRYYVTGFFKDRRFLVFDSTGRFLKSVGREGKGPGEYQGQLEVHVGKGDSIYVMTSDRITILGPNYRVAKTSNATLEPVTARLSNGVFAQVTNNAKIPGQETAEEWHSLHVLELIRSDGRSIRRIDVGPPRTTNELGPRGRELYPGPGGAVWLPCGIQCGGRSRIEQWDSAGHHIVSLIRIPDGLFEAFPEDVRTTWNVPTIRFDHHGLLWMLFVLPNGKTHRVTYQTESGPAERDAKEFDSILEVVDPISRTLLASRRFPKRFFLLKAGVVYAFAEGLDGRNQFEVYDVRMTPPSK